ncbi:MAG: UpxY family transcription antiterminator [candidate division KSB1 bacterium]|nr:UpxY family transcription antiterminator [candidate division KSB1 bacterium]MDZ7276124.1 UpxY family transcription antiterminator [candidate division KSB1 bacterium]MDZ7287096.1 UpxY family transcription antiterminator [candidate division KSB1 bacterium]MDZ7296979.1 UpxY family transcription antiterminator [candidate division KSB1 bacterium]MDZ7306192.1 UpxY family transcription antiterminator [candidate division KSB1 bacterium]
MNTATEKIRHWYALYTRPNFEKRVDRELRRLGLHAYLPLRPVLRQWSDRKKWIEMPLFSCYVFVHADAKERLLSLTPEGVVRMLGQHGQPSIIPEHEIAIVRKMLANDFDPEPIPHLVPGDLLEIIAGPLAGLRGVLRSFEGRQRLIIAFESIGQSLAINIDPRQLRKITGGPSHSYSRTVPQPPLGV